MPRRLALIRDPSSPEGFRLGYEDFHPPMRGEPDEGSLATSTLPRPDYKEPWEQSAEDEEAYAPARDRLRSLLNRKLIAGALAPQIQQPGLDYEIARGADTMRPAEERLLGGPGGLDMRGVPRSTAMSAMRYGDDPESQRMQLLRLLQGDRRLELQEGENVARQDRFDEAMGARRAGQDIAREGLGMRRQSLAQAETRLSRPPAGQIKESLALMTSRDFLDSIESKFEDVKAKVGPVWGRLHQVARKVGWDDPRVSVLQAELVDAMGTYLTTQTGAQRGMKEVEFLLQALPGIAQGVDTFEALLQSWRERIDRQQAARDRLFRELGYQGSGGETATPPEAPGGSTGGPGRTIPFKIPSQPGRTFNIPEHEVEEFLRDHPDARQK